MSSSSLPARLRAAQIWIFLVVAVLILGVIVWQQRDGADPTTDSGTVAALGRAPNQVNESGVSAALSDLQQAWDQRDRNAFVAAAGPSPAAKSWGAQTYDNLRELGVRSIDPQLGDGRITPKRADDTFKVPVEVTWEPGAKSGLPQHRTDAVTVNLQVRTSGDRFGIEGASAADDPMPLWLAGSLDVTRQGNRVIARVDGGASEPRLPQMLARAMSDVRRVHGKPQGPAFVVIPHSGAQSSEILGQSRGRLSRLAAMTTTLDGSGSSSAPQAVVINPEVFTPLDRRAAQVVLSHEITHEVTDATTAVAPLWVVEGYADYVALSGDRLDPTRSASQILRRVRDDGPPRTLPDDERFGSTSPRLGASYEGSWMFFRMLGETYDDATIAQFYRRVLRGQAAEVVAADVFGVGLEDLTAQWRQYLQDWARVAHPA